MAVTLEIDGVATPLPGETTLFAAAAAAGVFVPSSCRAQGRCRECLVEVKSGADCLTPRAPEEQHLGEGFRLTCRCGAAPGAHGRVVAHTLRRGSLSIETAGAAPVVRELDPAVTREGRTVLLDGRPVAAADGPLLGLAIDLGTTTVVVRCVDLETGASVATTAFENPQRFAGSDIMARIHFDSSHRGRLLQRTVLGYLGRAIAQLPVDPNAIFEIAVAANPTMRDLFFGLNVSSLGQRPYRSLTEHEWRAGKRAGTAIETTARRLGLPVHPEARVYGLPLVGGHVGADAAAVFLAIGAHRRHELTAIMDIGTNTELFLGRGNRWLAASCPAGPAFEGRGVTCGMPALEGAIARVRIGDDGAVACETIGGRPAEGLCGSGLVDLLGELRRTGRMNELGRLADELEEFPLVPDRGVTIHERDINELAQAKGAHVAGIAILAHHFGCAPGDIEQFYLAGGFGRHLDPEAARRIGLIPDLLPARIHAIGNAAIEGATLALCSVRRRRELESLVTTIEHVELETDPGFFDHFALGCQFVPVGTALPA